MLASLQIRKKHLVKSSDKLLNYFGSDLVYNIELCTLSLVTRSNDKSILLIILTKICSLINPAAHITNYLRTTYLNINGPNL